MSPISSKKEELPAFVEQVIAIARRYIDPEAIWLFGSQARGDASDYSDFDFGFSAPNVTHTQWAKFCVAVEEEARTLRTIDLVHIEHADPILSDKIREEGICLYER